jgi:predicted secreted protein
MKEKFGEKAEQIFKQRASTPEKAKILMELAAADPNEFVSLFTGVSAPTNHMDTSSFNTTSVASNGGDRSKIEGTKEWATKVRKEDPSTYWSQDFQYKLQQTVSKNPTLYFGS